MVGNTLEISAEHFKYYTYCCGTEDLFYSSAVLWDHTHRNGLCPKVLTKERKRGDSRWNQQLEYLQKIRQLWQARQQSFCLGVLFCLFCRHKNKEIIIIKNYWVNLNQERLFCGVERPECPHETTFIKWSILKIHKLCYHHFIPRNPWKWGSLQLLFLNDASLYLSTSSLQQIYCTQQDRGSLSWGQLSEHTCRNHLQEQHQRPQ